MFWTQVFLVGHVGWIAVKDTNSWEGVWIFLRKNLWPFGMGTHNYQKTQSIYGTSKKSTWTLDHGCSGYVQCESIICGGFFCASMQGIVFSMSELMLGQYTMLQAMVFIQLMLGCPECNCLRTALLSFVGIKTRSANIKHSLMMAREFLHSWNCCSSPVRLDCH